MLQQMQILGGACFGDSPLTISHLNKVNFFFGPNGSGKTTISRAFAGYERLVMQPKWNDSIPMNIKVYNRDFVDRILRESNRIPGVFVIGEKSVEAQARLDAIEEEGGERGQASDLLGRAQASLEKAEGRQREADEAIKAYAWDKYKALTKEHPSLSPAFTGRGGAGNSKDKLLDSLLALDSQSEDEPALDLQTLLSEAEAVFASDASLRSELPIIPTFTKSAYDGHALLEKKVVGSSEVTLSELVEQLDNSDWVSQGRAYLNKSNGRCPFCQEKAPANLANDLANMFDDQYSEQVAKLQSFATAFTEWAEGVRSAEGNYPEESKAQLDLAHYHESLSALMEAITRNENVLEKKQRTPSETVTFESVTQHVTEVNRFIEEANKRIKAHNELIQTQSAERPKLVDKCRRYLANVLLGEELATYQRKAPGLQRGVTKTLEDVENAGVALQNLDEEVRNLHRSVESTRPAIDQINALLHRSGFTSFTIVESTQLDDGYMLSRDGAALHEHSLSEGERTFIAFLYYLHQLDGRDGSDVSSRVLAVIDDPISSLDSDILFIVSALVRNLIRRALSGTDRIRQVIVLTHNVYFHKEITHLRMGDPGSDRTYFVIRKKHSAPSEVEVRSKNPVSTEYQRLWGEVRRAHDGEEMSIIGLENVLRRILESYFRIMGGGIWEDEITPLLTPVERPVLQSLFNWVNEGSHAVFEDIHYSPSAVSQETYLDVFRRVFEKTNQESHYRMMMFGKASLESEAS